LARCRAGAVVPEPRKPTPTVEWVNVVGGKLLVLLAIDLAGGEAAPEADDLADLLATLKPAELTVYEALPRPGEPPVTFLKLAKDSGYSYNHVRAAAVGLEQKGLLERVTGGVRARR
jgi:DNA-binding MarR family transcriptional regulator